MAITEYIDQINIAEKLDEEELQTIGTDCYEGYETDVGSRKEWEDSLEDYIKLATQVVEEKSFPWPNASNVKYPLLSTAAMQFAARAYPIIVPSDGKPAKCRVVGSDPQGVKAGRATRISEHMSYQLMEEMDSWEEDTDRLLMILAITGTCFRKTYFDVADDKPCSKLVLPKDLVVNYWSKSLEQSARKTQRLWLTKNEVKERQNRKVFLDIELGDPENTLQHDGRKLTSGDVDATTPYLILEQHTFLDLDKDGYAEPYIVTFDYQSKNVLRIVARYTQEDVELNEKGDVVKITPKEYYTKFGFIPNPDGGFYDLGFGTLLGALNESANTLVNQLIDAGTLNNLQSGFLAKGLRLKLGETRFKPGEWKAVNAVGDDLKKGIYPLPTKDPSPVLFQLLGMIVQSSKELASVAEIFVGKMPGQNTPATTTQATIEQGMKVFTSIFKRVYRALTQEFRKLYKINQRTIDPEKYVGILDNPAGQQDYEGDANDVVPAADPQAQTDTMKQQKAQAIIQALQMGGLDPMAATVRFLAANSVEDIQELLPKQENQQPPPEVQKMQMEMQMKQQEFQMKQQQAQMELQIEQQKAQILLQVEQVKLEIEQMRFELEKAKAELEMQKAGLDMELSHQDHNMKLQQGQDKLNLSRAQGAMKLEQQQKQAELKEEQKEAKADKE
jgi:chaperonin GroES